MYVFNHLKDFFTPHQSGFLPGVSTVNQLTYIYEIICSALDRVRIPRNLLRCEAFDRVWHTGLLFKLEGAGVLGKSFFWFSDYVFNRK